MIILPLRIRHSVCETEGVLPRWELPSPSLISPQGCLLFPWLRLSLSNCFSNILICWNTRYGRKFTLISSSTSTFRTMKLWITASIIRASLWGICILCASSGRRKWSSGCAPQSTRLPCCFHFHSFSFFFLFDSSNLRFLPLSYWSCHWSCRSWALWSVSLLFLWSLSVVAFVLPFFSWSFEDDLS